jgi:uncharacterized RDD family membrane protein YckC
MTTQPRSEASSHMPAVPQAVRAYQGRRAGVVTRMVASAIDLLVVVAILCAIYGILAGLLFLLHPSSFSWPAGLGWSIPVIGFGVAVPYLTLCWRLTGRTYGDALLGLRVVNYDGKRMRFVGALLRAVGCVVFPIGLLWVAVSAANRSVQDVIMRTSVIYDWSPSFEG